MIAQQCWPSTKELTLFWKLVWLSNSLRWHFWDIDWHLFVVVEVMDCRCQAGQVWWQTHTPKSKTMQWPKRPSLWINFSQICTRFTIFVWLSKFFPMLLHFAVHFTIVTEAIFININLLFYFNFFLLHIRNIYSCLKCQSIIFQHYTLELVFNMFYCCCCCYFFLHQWCSFMHCEHFLFALLFIHFKSNDLMERRKKK